MGALVIQMGTGKPKPKKKSAGLADAAFMDFMKGKGAPADEDEAVDEEESDEEMDVGAEAANAHAQSLIDAVKGGDASAVSKAFKRMVDACSAMKPEEYDDETEE